MDDAPPNLKTKAADNYKLGVVKVLSNIEFFVVVNIMHWQITSGLANRSSPTL